MAHMYVVKNEKVIAYPKATYTEVRTPWVIISRSSHDYKK